MKKSKKNKRLRSSGRILLICLCIVGSFICSTCSQAAYSDYAKSWGAVAQTILDAKYYSLDETTLQYVNPRYQPAGQDLGNGSYVYRIAFTQTGSKSNGSINGYNDSDSLNDKYKTGAVIAPAGVTKIGNYAFSASTTTTMNGYAINKNKTDTVKNTIKVSGAAVETRGSTTVYTAMANRFKNYLTAFSGYDCGSSLTTIGEGAFYGCSNLKYLDLSNNSGLTTIGANAFNGCTQMSYTSSSQSGIVLPDNITSIGANAFSGCSNLTLICKEGSKTDATLTAYAKSYGLTNAYKTYQNGSSPAYATVKQFTVTTSAGTGGSITATTKVNYGSDASITIKPDTGYRIATVTLNGSAQSSYAKKETSQTLTISGVKENQTVNATFEKIPYTLTINTTNCTYSASKTSGSTVYYGDTISYSFSANYGYHMTSTVAGSVTVTGNTTISGTAAVNTWTINGSVNIADAGTITGTGSGKAYNSSQSITVAAADGYRITSVAAGGVAKTVTNDKTTSFTFTMPNNDITVAANFEKIKYRVTTSAGTGGSITETADYEHGTSPTISITPDDGYKIKDVLVDGKSVGVKASHTFNNITAAHTVAAVFEKISCRLTIDASNCKADIGSGPKTFEYGDTVEINFTADPGYELDSIRDSDGNIYKNGTASFVIKKDMKVTAVAKAVPKPSPSAVPSQGPSQGVSPAPSASPGMEPGETPSENPSVLPSASPGTEPSAKPENVPDSVPVNAHYIRYYKDSVEVKKDPVPVSTARYEEVLEDGKNPYITERNLFTAGEGDSVTYTITPTNGYKVMSIVVDGKKVNLDEVRSVRTRVKGVFWHAGKTWYAEDVPDDEDVLEILETGEDWDGGTSADSGDVPDMAGPVDEGGDNGVSDGSGAFSEEGVTEEDGDGTAVPPDGTEGAAVSRNSASENAAKTWNAVQGGLDSLSANGVSANNITISGNWINVVKEAVGGDGADASVRFATVSANGAGSYRLAELIYRQEDGDGIVYLWTDGVIVKEADAGTGFSSGLYEATKGDFLLLAGTGETPDEPVEEPDYIYTVEMDRDGLHTMQINVTKDGDVFKELDFGKNEAEEDAAHINLHKEHLYVLSPRGSVEVISDTEFVKGSYAGYDVLKYEYYTAWDVGFDSIRILAKAIGEDRVESILVSKNGGVFAASGKADECIISEPGSYIIVINTEGHEIAEPGVYRPGDKEIDAQSIEASLVTDRACRIDFISDGSIFIESGREAVAGFYLAGDEYLNYIRFSYAAAETEEKTFIVAAYEGYSIVDVYIDGIRASGSTVSFRDKDDHTVVVITKNDLTGETARIPETEKLPEDREIPDGGIPSGANTGADVDDSGRPVDKEQPVIQINYYLDGGSLSQTVPNQFHYGSEWKLGVPQRPGYRFAGFYVGRTPVSSTAVITAKSRVTAKWIPITYGISYDLNGGAFAHPDKVKYMYAMNTSLSLPKPTRPGFRFEGWYIKGTDIKMTKLSKNVYYGGNLALEAKWSGRTAASGSGLQGNITYDLDGGRFMDPTKAAKIYVTSKTTTLARPVREGYKFEGWYIKDTDIKIVSIKKKQYLGNVTLCARWSRCTYTITYKANKGKGKMDKTFCTYDSMRILSGNGFVRTGYVFTGWNTKSDGTGISFKDASEVKNLTTKTNVPLYAMWKKSY